MSKVITQVNAAPAGDTFQIWVNRTNEVINCISTEVVTINTHANGALTTGNGFVEGVFGGRTMCGNTVRGGTVQTSANLNITSNVVCTGYQLTYGNVTINAETIAINGVPVGDANVTVETTGTGAQIVDFWDKFVYRGADYTLTIKDLNANAYQLSRVLLVHATGEAYVTEYGAVYSNTTQGEFSCGANQTHVILYLTPISTSTHVMGKRSLVYV